MAVSQNGFRANDRSLIASYSIPGGKVALRKGDVATVLVYFAKRFHSEVEPLKWPGCWGYAERKIRGGSSLSNHASGTALDLNAPAHWLGASGTFSASQVRAIDGILRDCDGVLRHGKDYRGRKDEMHVEINKGTSAVKSLANKIKAGKKPGPSGGATSGGSSGGGSSYGSASAKHEVGSRIMRKYCGGTDVQWLQRRLTKVGHKISDIDSLFGPAVEKAVKAFQKAAGIAVDGDVGPDTIEALRAAKVVAADPKPSKPSESKAPNFPLPSGHWYGPESSDSRNHSGYYPKDRQGIKRFQQKLKDRGWTIGVDGRFGSATKKIVRQFQAEKEGLSVDGGVGIETWNAIWSEPVT